MAKKSITDLKNEAVSALDAFLSAAADALEGGAVAFTAPAKAEPGSYSREELEEMDIKSLRDLAKRHSLDTIKKAEIIDALASDDEDEEEDEDEWEDEDEAEEDDEDSEDEDDEEADEDDEEEEEEDDDEGDEYTREELEEMSLRDLRALAKESGYSAADVKGLDQDAIIDLMLGEDEEADEDEEEPEEDEESEDGEELTEDDLRKMSLAELKEVASDIEIDVPRGIKKDALVELILDSAE